MCRTCLVILVAALWTSNTEAAVRWSTVPGYSALSSKQRATVREICQATVCYYGCSESVALCLERNPPVPTAWRLAKYISFLVGKGLTKEDVAKVIALRKESVHPTTLVQVDLAQTPRLGPASAKVLIVEYADFQCSHCAALVPVIDKVVSSYKGKVALYFKTYPLKLEGASLLAAKAALAAQAQGRFWPMAKQLFARPDRQTEVGVEQLARDAGLDLTQFRAALGDRNILRLLEKNKIEGIRFGLKGTPTLFVNGKRYRLRRDEMHLRDRIDEELELLK
jgi:protein-disulfide isomerase